jgi:cobalt-zinc-cadmium efflux system outer membrane protein
MYSSFSRPLGALLSAYLALGAAAHAQTPPSLREAVEAAWAFSPQARALGNRQAELAARESAASSFISGPPAVSLSHRSDRVGSNGGMREAEAEISFPLWNPGVRSAAARQVTADRAALESHAAMAKVKLAAEVRELAAQAALAQIERQVAARKLQEANALAADIERRVKAGDTARVDLLQAQGTLQQAQATQSQAEAALARSKAQWRALTGLDAVAPLDEMSGTPQQEHPALAAAQTQLRAAQARLAAVEADRSDPMEAGVGVTRERSAFGAASETSMRLSLRVPLGSYSRNAPKLAAARAEVDAAQAESEAAARTVQAEREAAAAELEAARRAEALAAQRERLGAEVQSLIAKSWRLGESDLPTRLRADSERFDAELAHARARIETRRAIAKLNQAFGALP